MAVKKKKSVAPPPPPPPPAAAHPTSSDEDEDSSSVEEDQFIVKPNPSKGKILNSELDEDKSVSDSGSDSESESPEKAPLTKPVAAPPKPSDSEDSSSEEEEGHEKEKEQDTKKTKSKGKEPETLPEKTAPESSEPDQSGSKKSAGIQRLWNQKDEMTLLNALLDYKVKNDNLPPRNEYPTFLSTFSGSLAFAVTEKQLYNKIRMAKFAYRQKKKKGHGATFQQPHDVAVYKICKELFGDLDERSNKRGAQDSGTDVGKKNRKKRKVDVRGSGLEEANGDRVSVDNGGDEARSHLHVEEMIRDMIRTQQSLGCISTGDVMARIEEKRLQDLEAKAKVLKIEFIKWRAREAELVSELLDLVADDMTDD